MSMYTDIPQDKLKWLDGFSGKTLAVLLDTATSAPRAWIPSVIYNRMVIGDYYVMTLTDGEAVEVLSIKRKSNGFDFKRGLDGTTAREWPIDTVIYQSFTSNQLAYLMRKAANVPIAPNDFTGNFVGTLTQLDPTDSVEKEYWVYAAADVAALPDLQYKINGTATAAFNVDAGVFNMQPIIDAGLTDHPAAEFCVNYREGGFSDWYLPANAELSALLLVKPNLPVAYNKNIVSSTCPESGGANPSWASQVGYLNWYNSRVRTDGIKTLTYLVVPFRRVLKP